ncbi:MAG TPA: glycosyltransferase family 4 protein [Planctomycetaceae bacterium]|nr:glycosyltransferase family 4 protein [Planctomycetaceae bacterium]
MSSASRRIVIVNHSLRALGGGEVSTLAYYRAFEDLGFEPLLVSCETEQIDAGRLRERFGWDGPLNLQYCRSESEIDALTREAAGMLNHSFHHDRAYPCRWSAYSVMFPHGYFRDSRGRCRHAGLRQYGRFLCNSQFTADYVAAIWGDDLPTTVLSPPFDLTGAPEPATKRNLIAHIGRFGIDGHTKNQQTLIAMMSRLWGDRALPADARLRLMGSVDHRPENLNECRRLQREALGLPIEFGFNLPRHELQRTLGEASIYVHATGYSADEMIPPQCCEHFGIAILEAMSAGCVPVVFARGGAVDFVEHGRNGFLFLDADQAGRQIAWLLQHPAERERMAERAIETSRRYRYEDFRERLATILNRSRLPIEQPAQTVGAGA